jgi:ATP-dependent protease ClpP protease subunit
MKYDAVAEHAYAQRKIHWRAQHRWATQPPETWASLVGDVDERAVRSIVAIIGQAPENPVCLTIRSRGGDPLAAHELYQALRGHAAPVSCFAEGHCDSAAIIPFMAGDARIAARDASFLVHGVALDLDGRPSATRLQATAEILTDLDEKIIQLIAIRAERYSVVQLRSELRAETVLNAEAALLRGVTTGLV